MQNQKRKSITSGLLLILIGLVFLSFRVCPGLRV